MSCSCGGAACGCCQGIVAQTPQPVSNTFGQSAIAYRCGTQPEFYASLIAALTDNSRPALAALQTREPDDLTIALLDAFACMCDVLTFYTERLAQESYLRTATDPTSLQELGRLLGYRPNPGAAAQTYLAFTLTRPPKVPAGISTDPGVIPPAVPAAVQLPVGLRINNVPGPGQQQVTFQTVEAICAQPQWSSASLVTTQPQVLTTGSLGAWLVNDATSNTIKPGDRLLLLGNQTGSTSYGNNDDVVDPWDAVVVTSVTVQPNTVQVAWSPALSSDYSSSPPAVLVLRTTTTVFGANAPDWNSMSSDFQTTYTTGYGAASGIPQDWPGFTAMTTVTVDGFSVNGFRLDGSHPEMMEQPSPTAVSVLGSNTPPGAWLFTDSPYGQQLYLITGRAETTAAQYAISGRVTDVGLAGDTLYADITTPRDLTVYGGGLALTLANQPDTDPLPANPASSTTLTVTADWSAMTAGRTLIVTGPPPGGGAAQTEVVTLAAAALAAGPVTTLTLTSPGLANSYDRASVVVYGNIAQATQGSSVSQILGNGTATPGQTFQITSPPITYLQAATTTGTASTLDVTVDDITWTEVPTLYGRGPAEQIFTTDLDAAGNTNVVFGDGAGGARPATGTLNVRANYRQGLGSQGNVGARSLSQLMDRPLGLSAVTNPIAASGGVDPETAAAARTSIPLPVLTLGRAVSVQDYADYALAFTGIAKASASVLPIPPAGPTIVITVAGDNDTTPSPTELANLVTSLQTYGDPFAAITVLAYTPVQFQAAATVAVAADRTSADVLAAVAQAWQDAFSFDSRSLHQPVYLSEVVTIAQNVPGVLGVDLQSLYTGNTAALDDRLLASDAAFDPTTSVLNPSELLTIDPTQLQLLAVMP